jgi:L-alanine-DL-glutamate epimerase-like enolase superfamily enzyme
MATEERLMADANQAWSPAHALAMLPRLERHGLGWLEEPIAADAPDPDWRRLRDATTIPLAAGENIRGDAAFDATLAAGYLGVVQPDIAKWGGFSACAPLAGRILAAGQRYCPHWLGGGIGLAASAQLLAAAGGDGLLEVDVNDNPLREALLPKLEISAGRLALPPGPGLGVEPDLAALAPFRLA